MSELTLEYFFEGDDSLPFHIADFDAPPTALTADRIARLADWIGDVVAVNGDVEPGVSIKGPVYIAKGAHIESGVDITGPVYVGEDCSIHHGSQLRPGTILGRECVVGHTAEIKNSVCMVGAKLQSGSFVGDSVVGRGGRIGSGAILTNRRFAQDLITLGGGEDRFVTEIQFFGAVIGDYARIGANATTAPGTLVGPYSWILPNVSAYGFIPRETRVMSKQELSFISNPAKKLRSGRGEYHN
jgi:NDP-sugar pyrophosphorylase family protein